ncbi:hypothetical protein C5Y97_16310 [Blastopirellula marina]|uniref:Uncharacterized protein n=2 Tax=Blastopirellula marina TaxID=124 RepID=A0A2S8FP53_9BACT|nr:hypothetical protein C5Y98_16300 [Blastopirellula marina]PTL43577.1 hypothetical protein C5Y97_16310 [Blastopirellula marina]
MIRPALDPFQLTDEDLPDICLRMHLILDSIEFTRCEGRLIYRDIFDPIDTLYSDLLRKETNRLDDWRENIEKFGDYYELSRMTKIEVSQRAVTALAYMFERLRIKPGDT